jgi:hypothetical protein
MKLIQYYKHTFLQLQFLPHVKFNSLRLYYGDELVSRCNCSLFRDITRNAHQSAQRKVLLNVQAVEHKLAIVLCRVKRAGSDRVFKLIENKPTTGVYYMETTLIAISITFPV